MPTLNWIGKEAVVEHHKQVPFSAAASLRPCALSGRRRGQQLLLVQGDNLEA